MKSVKIIVLVCAAFALAATHGFAEQYKIKLSGVTYTNAFPGTIVAFKFTNKEIIALFTTTKGAQLLYDTSGQSSGTNLIVLADACGNSLLQFPIGDLNLVDKRCIQVTNVSLTEEACSIPISFLGAEGTAVVDFKTLISSKGTNLLATATGVFAGPYGPGTFTISLAGAFTKPKSCP